MMKQPAMGPYRSFSKPVWWLLFLGSTYVLSLAFQTFRTFTVTPDWPNGLAFAGAIAALLVLMAVMLFDSYAKEKQLGNIHHPIRLFEWLYERVNARQAGTPQADTNQGGTLR
jgi:hypothetical protein